MRRPVGVIVAAVILGLMALMGTCAMLLSLAFAIFTRNPIIPNAFRPFIILTQGFGLALSLFCAWTVVGLFRMRRWARITTIVLGAALFLIAVVSAVGIFMVRNFVPAPPGSAPGTMSFIFFGIAAFYLFLSLIGAWWVVYFSLAHVRAAFSSAQIMVTNPDILPPGGAAMLPGSEGTPGWRVVIIVWACLMLVGVLSLPMLLVMHVPLFIYGMVLTGARALAALLILVAIEIYLGVGLLKKWRPAWYVALAWQIFAAGSFISFLIPGMMARFVAYQQQLITQWAPASPVPPFAFTPPASFMAILVIFSAAIIALFTIALFKRKADYLGA